MFPTDSDNQFEDDGYVIASVFLTTNISRISQARINVLNDVREESLVSSTHKEVIPEVVKAVNSSVFSAISNRMGQFPNDSFNSTNSSNISNSTLRFPFLEKIAESFELHNWRNLINDLSFVFNATHRESGPPPFYIWGKGNFQKISGEDKTSGLDWDGRVIGGHLGFDTKFGSNTVGGLLSTYSNHNLDYHTDSQNYGGQSTHKMFSIFPYLGWSTLNQSFKIWTSVGYGLGQVKTDSMYRAELCRNWKKVKMDDNDFDPDAQCPHQLYTDTNFPRDRVGY